MSLLGSLPIGAIVGLDSAPLIYFIEAHPRFGPVVKPLFFERLENGGNRAVTSVVTLSEVLVQPIRTSRPDVEERYRELLMGGPNVLLAEITRSIAERAARLRAIYGVRLPDAYQIAAAIEHGATHFLTNDDRLRKVQEVAVLVLSDYAT